MTKASVSVVIPSFNQGQFLDQALQSVFDQNVKVEVSVLDGGSKDNSLTVIEKWSPHLMYWRSAPDNGQAAAINEGLSRGRAPFVCWLNSDDMLVDGGLKVLIDALHAQPNAPAAYGKTWDLDDDRGTSRSTWVEPFSQRRLAMRCIISQPGTLMRREAWNEVSGLNANLHMALDYDLWWRLYLRFGPLAFVDQFVATNRLHDMTKTRRYRAQHYSEAIELVRRYNGSVPLKWWLYRPYQVWYRSGFTQF